MSNTQLSPGMTNTLRARLMLTTSNLASYPNSLMMVVADGLVPNEESTELTLVAPGFDGLDLVRRDLCRWLKTTMISAYGHWINDVSIETDHNGVPSIAIRVNDPSSMPDVSIADRALQLTKTFLGPIANRNFRSSVVTLSAGQKLVPLDFQINEPMRDSLELTIPREHIMLNQAHGLDLPVRYRTDDTIDEELTTYEHLQYILNWKLGKFDWIGFVDIKRNYLGATLSINLNTRLAPVNTRQINQVQRTVCQAIKELATETTSTLYKDLVFIPAWPYRDSLEDFLN